MTAVGAPPLLPHPPRKFANAAEWLHALGDVPLERIIVDPPPGTATEADLLRLIERDGRLCELIDGTLVEKPMGFWEGQIAAQLIILLGNFVRARDLGSVFALSIITSNAATNYRIKCRHFGERYNALTFSIANLRFAAIKL